MIRTVTCIVIVCDVCQYPFDTGDHVAHFATADEGIRVAIDSEWTDLGGGRIACDRSNPAHDDARDAALLTKAAAS